MVHAGPLPKGPIGAGANAPHTHYRMARRTAVSQIQQGNETEEREREREESADDESRPGCSFEHAKASFESPTTR